MAHRSISKKASRRLSYLARIIARDGNGCVWCQAPLGAEHPHATIEHVLPLSAGGPDIFENMLLACGDCNHRRQSTPALTWAAHCEHAGMTASRTIIGAALRRAHLAVA